MRYRTSISAPACAAFISLVFCLACQQGTPPEQAEAETEAQRVGDASDWCNEHALPESMCTKCNPGLTPSFQVQRDWCGEHGFPESVCPICNPMRAPEGGGVARAPKEKSDWCGAHALPESKCTRCNPELTAGFKAKGDWCEEHGFPESACPICNPVPLPMDALEKAVPPGTLIRLASSDIVHDVGIKTVPAGLGGLDKTISVVGTLDYDRNHMAQIQSPVSGLIRAVRVDLGDEVEPGDPLFVIENADVGELQARLRATLSRRRLTKANLERAEQLRAEGVNAQRDLDKARQEHEQVAADERYLRDALRLSGARGGSGGRIEVRSPVAGSVVSRPAVLGGRADNQTPLATVADLSRMWVMLDIPEAQSSLVAEGQALNIKAGTDRFEGVVDWVASEIDPHKRTVRVRATLPNPDRTLRAGQFVKAQLTIEGRSGAVVVPREALQWLGETRVVFVQTGEAVFEPRAVAAGRRSGHAIEVRGAVEPGDRVVTTGAFLLKTEMSKESIGAGCCEVEAGGGK